ncbi:hypothetical protein IV38_GL000956 [Lactobacillus selangorensis]|uniref:Uncharacterized protein n=1 Tax=Lactobacillus selangorensis TaxID=81857 RepID=A0A0R2G622_9LACO|nr:hypothetical protein [Lactobacillus selangorensis]KRN28751.1 hypothetical protein IV38_GL000956 [Lactobacillus selangorensis]KRN32839.1 hypothetical protein IV40_GL000897 [Lactobacillus selangorensis]
MRYREWLFLLIVCSVGTAFANWLGYGVSLQKSIPGLTVLILISLLSVVLVKVIPVKIPLVAYCSILGLLFAAPFSPIHTFVINSVNAIQFAAPFTIVGSFAGIAIGDKLKEFVSQGWKYIIVGLLGMTGTFLGSILWDSFMLKITNAI